MLYFQLFVLLSLWQLTKQRETPTNISNISSSPIEVVDYSTIGDHEINVRVHVSDPENICCATNYSIVWDDDGELIVFVADNLFCPSTLEALRADALHPDRFWESLTQAVNRAYHYGDTRTTQYKGNFPGVTSHPVSFNTTMTLRRCFQPFVNLLLDSEQFLLARQVLSKNITENVLHPPDVENARNLPTYTVVDPEYVREPSAYEEEGSSIPLHGNPILPKYKANFWASVAFPSENISTSHSQPHVDGFDSAFASVFTLTKDPMYEACATTFNKVGSTTIEYTQDIFHIVSENSAIIQQNAIRSGESRDSGWLNTSKNRFSEVMVMVRNKYNRFIMYPSNRLHTAFIPGKKYLNDDPHKGRLTLNTFWDVYKSTEGGYLCEGSTFASLLEKHYNSSISVPRTPKEYFDSCKKCKQFPVHCGWCPYHRKCLGDSATSWQEIQCPNVPVIGTSNGMLGLETSCEESAKVMDKCLSKNSCEDCRTVSGCAWCANSAMCTLEVLDVCETKISHIGELGANECPKTKETNINCNAIKFCHECRDTPGCSWCNHGIPICVADMPLACMTSNLTLVVGGSNGGTGQCEKEMKTDMTSRMPDEVDEDNEVDNDNDNEDDNNDNEDDNNDNEDDNTR
jgi:hypothetical protein